MRQLTEEEQDTLDETGLDETEAYDRGLFDPFDPLRDPFRPVDVEDAERPTDGPLY